MGTSTPRCKHRENGDVVPVTSCDVRTRADVIKGPAENPTNVISFDFLFEGGHNEFVLVHAPIGQ